jgi:aquaporin Z
MTKKMAAEFVGTFALVLFGCGAAVVAGPQVGNIGVAFAFGLTIVAMAYGIGPISGCHLNPAVSFGLWAAGRMSRSELPGYVAAQCAGAIVGAGVLFLIVSGQIGVAYDIANKGLGQNGYGIGYNDEYNWMAAAGFEVTATFFFLVVILGATQKGAPQEIAGLVVGLTLTAIHIVGIQITGVSVNPARSLGPAIFVGPTALAQLPLFIVAPLAGAGLAGLAFRTKLLSEEEEA